MSGSSDAPWQGEAGGFDPPGRAGDVLRDIALFPLPGMVLFPRAILPLHIFEPRYRQMTADVLAGDRLIVMAQFAGGWEQLGGGEVPPVRPVCCLGRVGEVQALPDGRSNLLLHGLARVRLETERPGKPYRRADVRLLGEDKPFEIDLDPLRQRLREVFAQPPLAGSSLGRQFARLLEGPLPTADLADVMAFELVEPPEVRQALLEELDAAARVRALVGMMEQANRDPAADALTAGRGLFEDESEDEGEDGPV